MSGKDGRVRWKLPLVPVRTGRAARAVIRLHSSLVTTDGRVALAIAAPIADTLSDHYAIFGET